jgi:hypothetical protein
MDEARLREYLLRSPYQFLVDLGVWEGRSSRLLLEAAARSGGKVCGIDNELGGVDRSLESDPRYRLIIGDSVTLGHHWQLPRPDFIFVDTIHVKEHVMCELAAWYDKLLPGGTIAFHDTQWDELGMRDSYAGKKWETVASGLKAFFQIDSLDSENEAIRSTHYPEELGMTFIFKKCEKDFQSKINWAPILEVRREILVSILEKISHKNLEI